MACDLRTHPAVPIRTLDGDSHLVGFRELMSNAHTYAGLDIAIPPAESMMLRVLYTIAARVTGLDTATPDTWDTDRNNILTQGHFDADQVDTYLDDPRNVWDLFHPTRPWMQDPRLTKQAERKSINTLDPTRPRDSSPIWWRHTHNDYAPEMAPSEALMWLLTALGYGPAGAGGTREVTSGSTTVRDHYMSSGPLRSTVTFHPIGRTLFETLITGIPAPTGDNTEPDTAPWETTEQHDPLTTPPDPTWPAGILVGRSRHGLLLHTNDNGDVDGCYYTWAWKEPTPETRDPYCIYDQVHRPGEEPRWFERRADIDRAMWRDVDALLLTNPTQQRPRAIADTATLPKHVRDELTVRAIGWDQDRQTRDRAWFVADTPTVLRYLHEDDPQRAEYAHHFTQIADLVGNVMASSLASSYRAQGFDKQCPWVGQAKLIYWSEVEPLFWRQLSATTLLGEGTEESPHTPIPGDGTSPELLLTRLALDTISRVTWSTSGDPRAAKAAAEAAAKTSNTIRKKQKKEAANAH